MIEEYNNDNNVNVSRDIDADSDSAIDITDINYKSNEIYENLKEYILKNSKYKNVKVRKNEIQNEYPIIIFEEISNGLDSISQDENQLNEIRELSFEINIVAVSENGIDSTIICDYLSTLVINVMQRYYNMRGGIRARFKNINSSRASKNVLRFNCKWLIYKNILF